MNIDQPTDSAPVVATLVINYSPADADDTASTEPGNPSAPEEERASVLQLREGTSLRLGRAKTNDVVLNNRNVSRFHAIFSASSSGVVLSDLSSLNGTFVNGTRISTPTDLGSGDVVTIGDTTISVKLTHGDSIEGDASHGRTQTAQLAAVVVTVLVVDVCGYTKICESLPPQDVTQMLHSWFQQSAEIVSKHGGTVDKYIGDCVMSLWRGSLESAGRQAQSAVNAAVEIMRATERLSQSNEWAHQADIPWACRVALNTGEALMGTIGGGGRRDFTVLGDTVNVAFRLEGIAGKLDTDFIMSAATAEHVKNQYPVRALGEVNVEGRRGHVSVFSLDQWR